MKEFNLIRTDLYQSSQLATLRMPSHTVRTGIKVYSREAQKNPGTPYGDFMLVCFGIFSAYMIFRLFDGFFVKH